MLEVTRLDRSKLTPYIFSIAKHSNTTSGPLLVTVVEEVKVVVLLTLYIFSIAQHSKPNIHLESRAPPLPGEVSHHVNIQAVGSFKPSLNKYKIQIQITGVEIHAAASFP